MTEIGLSIAAVAGAVPDPPWRSRSDKMLTCFCAEIDAWKRLPLASFIFINQVLTYVAVFSSARLRPKAMQDEVARIKAVFF